jgi:hypothetical protein
LPSITGVGATNCGPGSLTLSATAGAGEIIDWYSAATGGIFLANESASYTTPVLSNTTTYYVQATNPTNGCISASRVSVTATINPLPSILSVIDASNCGSGSLLLSATTGLGETIDWYSGPAGGALLSSGSMSYTTPSINNTTSYYAQARNTTTGCISASRVGVTATINTFPLIPTGTDATNCGPGSVMLSATPEDGETIDWYSSSIGGTLLSSGSTSYATPSISSATSYYAQARNISTGCISPSRVLVTATINGIPSTPTGTNVTRCGSGSVLLSATAGAGETIDWYSASTGGTLLSSGSTSYTTPNISSTTSYYAQARNTSTGCISSSRVIATASITPLPSTPIGVGASSCGPGSVTLSAMPSAGATIDWYSASIDGSLLSIESTSYTTPSISTTTSYYAQARDTITGCISASLAIITATINPLPSTPTGADASNCGPGTVLLSANADPGETIDWYSESTDGTLLFSGSTTYTTPIINSTTSYYAQSRIATTGCISESRVTVLAIINTVPSLPAGTSASRCGTGSLTLSATPGVGETIDWYSASTGGTLLLRGSTSYSTPSISTTTS